MLQKVGNGCGLVWAGIYWPISWLSLDLCLMVAKWLLELLASCPLSRQEEARTRWPHPALPTFASCRAKSFPETIHQASTSISWPAVCSWPHLAPREPGKAFHFSNHSRDCSNFWFCIWLKGIFKVRLFYFKTVFIHLIIISSVCFCISVIYCHGSAV